MSQIEKISFEQHEGEQTVIDFWEQTENKC